MWHITRHAKERLFERRAIVLSKEEIEAISETLDRETAGREGGVSSASAYFRLSSGFLVLDTVMIWQIPLWARLRFVSNSSAAKATILIPLIGYLVLFNQTVVSFLNLIKELNGSPDAGVSYRLIFLYLGLCAISLGVLVYGWYCPNEVKHYGSAAAFVQGDGPSLRGFVIDNISKMLADNKRYHAQMMELSDEFRSIGQNRTVTESDRERYRTEHLHLYFDFLNRSHPAARAVAVVSYAIGFGLLAVPSAEVFWGVMKILYKKIAS
ncbi:hypothetical protein [Bradyrhizobium sp. 604_D8_N2_3]|uniref:hypothetical protein n=1 Tax=Bradyrhizobium sp. 604_D8_N2_3 TaxID=3240370 RepID=UPI003F1E6FF0